MPSVSEAQRRAAGAALAAKEGRRDPKTLFGAALQMFKSMTIKQLREFASGSGKKLPDKKVPNPKSKKVRKTKT